MARLGVRDTQPVYSAAVTDVIVVGAGERAHAWLATIQHTERLHLAAHVESNPRDALAAHPRARVAVALPPRSARNVAELLVEQGRKGLVAPPVFAPNRLADPTGSLRVAHGWVSLPAHGWLLGIAERAQFERATLTVRGLPDAERGDLDEVLWQALAWLRRVFPSAGIRSVELPSDSEAVLTLEGPGAPHVTLSASCHGQSFDAVLAGPTLVARASYQPGSGVHAVFEPDAPRSPARRLGIAPAAERALAALLEPDRADDWAAACDVAQRIAELSLPPPARAFARAGERAKAEPEASLHAVGLDGALPDDEHREALAATLPAEPFEVLAFRAGLKPVVLLTVKEGEVAKVREWLTGAHLEIQTRQLSVGAHDVWQSSGGSRVEIFASKEPTLARRAAELHADPSGSLGEMGELMGYPPCCVEAFARQVDRGNNTMNRYASAARTREPGPWPWELNDTWLKLVPFFPCSYTCEAALRFARAVAAELSLEEQLARPTLYLSHDNALAFGGAVQSDGSVRYDSVRVTPGAARDTRRLARLATTADTVSLGPEELSFRAGGRVIASLSRADPGLAILMPFGSA
jgi:hypothetical protein